MSTPKVLSTVVNFTRNKLSFRRHARVLPRPASPSHEDDRNTDPELKLPKRTSLVIMLLASALFQVSFFIIVSSSNMYAAHLGGSSTFSGLVIGIPTVFSGLLLIPMTRIDRGQYTRPLNVACAAALAGNVLYALAYRTHFLYLILIGRIVLGFAFTFFMYGKRFCSDSRIVGVRRRTTLAGWLVVGQGFGFSAGPFLGGVLYKVGFTNAVFNGFTSPGWVMAGVWAAFWVVASFMFEDVPTPHAIDLVPMSPAPTAEASFTTPLPLASHDDEGHRMDLRQWGVIGCMCWYAMTCFFILGGWEVNIPIFTEAAFRWSPFAAGNFIAIGGVSSFPFLFLNVWFARRAQDRHILALGASLGLSGLVLALALLNTGRMSPWTLFPCWFLVALGFNLASTVTLSLLTKQLPGYWNGRISLAIQYSNYLGRVTGAVWGGAGVQVGMMRYVGLQLAVVGIGVVIHMTLWRELKAKTG